LYQRKKRGENMRMDNAKFIIKFMPDFGSTSLWPINEEARKTFGTPIQYRTFGCLEKECQYGEMKR